MIPPRPLPDDVRQWCSALGAPARLVAHLSLVHDVALELLAGIIERFGNVEVDRKAVAFGAAAHDIGKVRHLEELTGPGHQHERAGERLLLELGVPACRARFARTQSDWQDSDARLEDLIVAIADHVWKGKRNSELESAVVSQLAAAGSVPEWDVWLGLDELLERIARDADHRLAWQQMHT